MSGYHFNLYTNSGDSTSPQFAKATVNPFSNINVHAFTTAFGDMNDNGDPDMLVGGYDGIYFYRNTEIEGIVPIQKAISVELFPNTAEDRITIRLKNRFQE